MRVKIKKSLDMTNLIKKRGLSSKYTFFLKLTKSLLQPTSNFLIFGCGPRVQLGYPWCKQFGIKHVGHQQQLFCKIIGNDKIKLFLLESIAMQTNKYELK